MFITPEYENILLLLVGRRRAGAARHPGIQPARLRPAFYRSERHDAYNVGMQQGIGSALRLDVRTGSGRSPIPPTRTSSSTPASSSRSTSRAADLTAGTRASTPDRRGLRGYLSLGHVHALYDPPFVGGLFLDAERSTRSPAAPSSSTTTRTCRAAGLFWDIPHERLLARRHPALRLGPGHRRRHGGRARQPGHRLRGALRQGQFRLRLDPNRVKPRTIVDFSPSARICPASRSTSR